MPKKSKAKPPAGKVVATNRKARHTYEILESIEAGLVLSGGEVKSLRQTGASLQGSFAVVKEGEIFLVGMHIPQYTHAGYAPHEPARTRKLLLHKDEIRRLRGKTSERGLTLVPLQCYFKHGLAKVELGLARGKKLYDRREDIKRRDAELHIERVMRRRR